jgi:uncharacterized protein (DUF2249 family)
MVNVVSLLSQTNVPATRPCETMDVRELPPPRQLEHTLQQLSEIDDSVVLLQVNDRRPRQLALELDAREYHYETVESGDAVATVIWKN